MNVTLKRGVKVVTVTRRNSYYTTPEWYALRAKVIRRSKGRCEVPGCCERGLVVDHIVSRRQGGADHESNLRHLCRSHDNQAKEDATGKRRSGGVFTVPGCDSTGRPLDPNHPWNRR